MNIDVTKLKIGDRIVIKGMRNSKEAIEGIVEGYLDTREWGAIGLDKEVVVIGHRENMLMYLDCISVFDSVDNWNRDLHFKMAERIIKGWPLWKQNAVRSYINTSLSDR